jgi:hypothetical protein
MAGKFTPNRQGIQSTFGPSGPVGRHVMRLLSAIEQRALAKVGVKTGQLKNSARKELQLRSDGVVGVLRFDAPHAILHHEGTRPHLIVPRSAKVLRFPGRSGIVFARRVNHPGTKPNRFLYDAMVEVIRGG